MTVDEYTALVLNVRSTLVNNIKSVLPSNCRVEDRYVLSGAETEENWISSLAQDDGTIRNLLILLGELPIGDLAGTRAGSNFAPNIKFFFELYHKYSFGTDLINTEVEFIKDCARIQYGIGKFRSIAGQSVSRDFNFRLGIRPSSVQPLHLARGELNVDLLSVRYD